jgi:hypothetical protein
MSSAVEWITRRAKQIRKGRPNMQWKSAVKSATSDYYREQPRVVSGTKKRKVSGTRKSPKKRAVKRKVSGVKRARPRKVSGKVSGKNLVAGKKFSQRMGEVTLSVREQKDIIKGALGEFMARQYLATTKPEKKKLGKKISELKRKLAALNRLSKS